MSIRRRPRIPSARFLVLEEALRVHETARGLHYTLDEFCEAVALGAHLHVRLTWRSAEGDMLMLRLRLRLPA